MAHILLVGVTLALIFLGVLAYQERKSFTRQHVIQGGFALVLFCVSVFTFFDARSAGEEAQARFEILARINLQSVAQLDRRLQRLENPRAPASGGDDLVIPDAGPDLGDPEPDAGDGPAAATAIVLDSPQTEAIERIVQVRLQNQYRALTNDARLIAEGEEQLDEAVSRALAVRPGIAGEFWPVIVQTVVERGDDPADRQGWIYFSELEGYHRPAG